MAQGASGPHSQSGHLEGRKNTYPWQELMRILIQFSSDPLHQIQLKSVKKFWRWNTAIYMQTQMFTLHTCKDQIKMLARKKYLLYSRLSYPHVLHKGNLIINYFSWNLSKSQKFTVIHQGLLLQFRKIYTCVHAHTQNNNMNGSLRYITYTKRRKAPSNVKNKKGRISVQNTYFRQDWKG